MKALSILQPWAYAILHLGKDIENRTWRTGFRGRFLIHAGKGFDYSAYDWLGAEGFNLPLHFDNDRGGFIGSSVLRDCVQASESIWFEGPHGFVLQGSRAFPLIAYPGRLGFFDVPDDLVPAEVIAA